MIYTERVINVKNGVATIDQPIILFRGDRNIEIVFEIVNSKFKFSEKGNYILDIGAKYGQLAVEMPDGTDLFTEIAECLDGKVIFKITGDMINEIAENGFYSFHVRLFNDDKTSRVTIPPIMEGIEIREPIVIEGDAIFPIVDMGGADIAPIDSDEETFIDENGKLDIQWKTGDIISSTRLNQMVEFVNVMEEKLVSEDNLKDYATIEYVDTKLDVIDTILNAHEGFINDIESTAEQAKYIATDAQNTIDGKYDELSGQLNELFNNDERFEASVAVAEANAKAALEGIKDRATVSYVDLKDTELSQRIENLENNPVTPDLSDYDTRIETLEDDTTQLKNRVNNSASVITELKIRVNGNASSINDLEELGIEFDNRIKVVENVLDGFDNSDGIYNIASKTYVEERIGEFHESMDGFIEDAVDGVMNNYGLDNIDNELSNRPKFEDLAYIDEAIEDHRARIETLEQAEAPDLSGYVTNKYLEAYLDGNYPKWEDLTYLDDALEDHNTRIETLENSQTNPEAPDLSGYVTKEYLEGNYRTHMINLTTFATVKRVETEIDKAIGNINDILDSINGEEI